MDNFKGEIRCIKIYGDDFWLFYNKQTQKIKERILWTIRLVKDIPRVPEQYLKHLEGSEGLYEIRVSSGNNIFRIFCFFDEGQLVILLNAFQKKTPKTPTDHLERAKKLKKQYYEDKKQNR